MRGHGARVTRQALVLVRRDFSVELRAGETLGVTLPFAATALLLIALAIGANVALLRTIAPGVLWSVVLLFGALVSVRHNALEPAAHRDALTLLGVDPVARFVAQTTVGAVLLAAVEATLGLLAIVLYDPPLRGWTWMILLIPLVAVGIAALGSLTSALTARVRGRSVLGPLLLVPLALPLVVGATQVLEGAVYHQSPVPWLLLLVAVDLVVLSLGVAIAPWAEEESSP